MNIAFRPTASANPPRAVAPTRIPASYAAVTNPASAVPSPNSTVTSGSATPVMKTTIASKNFPAHARPKILDCIDVMGASGDKVPSGHWGTSLI